MSEKLPISVHVLTRNSARTLGRALQSLPPCSEILVVDGGSTDGTVDIARSFGARILEERSGQNGLPNFAALRNIALRNTTQPWIFILDSDEELSQELRNALMTITASDTPAAFLVPRHYVDRDGTVVLHASTYPNERVFFFHRDVAEEWIKPVHERIRLKPGTAIRRLQGTSLAALPTIEEFKEKNRRYIAVEVQESRDRGWMHWLRRVAHTLRSRTIATVRLLLIWLIPRRGKRLPLRHELLRYWYAWTLLVQTCPLGRT